MSSVRPVVVVIEDDAKLRRLLCNSLNETGLDARGADGGQAGLELAAARNADLVIIDLGLPDLDGLEVIRALRARWQQRPLIVLSGRGDEATKLAALEMGADDYVMKPFGLPELQARVRAALRRAARRTDGEPTGIFRAGAVAIDLIAREVRRDGQAVELTPNEYRVLAVLARNAGMLVGIDQLAHELWGPLPRANSRQYLRSYVSGLRHKLEADPARPRLLQTEAGLGYRLALGEEGPPEPGPLSGGTPTSSAAP
jgi:two-component system KDP operon response regulator KdpE